MLVMEDGCFLFFGRCVQKKLQHSDDLPDCMEADAVTSLAQDDAADEEVPSQVYKVSVRLHVCT